MSYLVVNVCSAAWYLHGTLITLVHAISCPTKRGPRPCNVSTDGWEKNLIAALHKAQYAFEPGTHATASELGAAVLSLALARAAGKPYAEYVAANILTPLGMSHSRVTGGGVSPLIQTTIADLAHLGSFLMLAGPESVLSRSDLEENYRRVWVGNSVAVVNPSEWFGIGYDGETWTSNHYYFIPSIDDPQPGFAASFWFEPRRHAGVILLHRGNPGGALGQMIHTYVYTLNAQKVDAGRQDPSAPLPYTSEEVSFENTAGISLAGSLTVPQGKASFAVSAIIGITAGLSNADDTGRRYLIGVAAAVQLAIFPVWLGAAAILGSPDGAVGTRIESFLINLATISLAAVAAYAALHLQPGRGWAAPRSGRAEGRQ